MWGALLLMDWIRATMSADPLRDAERSLRAHGDQCRVPGEGGAAVNKVWRLETGDWRLVLLLADR